MPGYCAPWPGNRNATARAVGRGRAIGRRAGRARASSCDRLLRASTATNDRRCGQPRPPDLQRVGDVRQLDVGMRLEMAGELRRSARSSAAGDCALSVQDLRLARDGARSRRRQRRLLEDHVGVRAAEPERADRRRAAARSARGHGRSSVLTKNGLRREVDLRVRRSEVQARRDPLVVAATSAALMIPATPAAASRWPMLLFSEPIAQYCRRLVSRRNAWVSAATSIGSPSDVPVPCASTMPIVSASTSATASASSITAAWPSMLGAV